MLRWVGKTLYWLRLHRAVIWLNRRAPKVLAYHACEPVEHELIRGLDLNTRPETFNAHMEFLERHYTVISVEQMATGRIPERAVAITFDDGYRSVYEHAFPNLRARGWPATVYLIADALDNRRLVWVNELLHLLHHHCDTTRSVLARRLGVRPAWPEKWIVDRLIERADPGDTAAALAECREAAGVETVGVAADAQLYLSRMQIAEMSNADITFGNHSVSHPNWARLDQDGQRAEVRGGREALAGLPGYIDSFAYPFGVGSPASGSLAAGEGHHTVMELGGWNAPLDCRSVGRVRVFAESPAAFFAELEVVAPIKAWLKRRLPVGRRLGR